MNWQQLRPVGNLRVLKVSYVILAIVPFISKYENIATFLGLSMWILVVLFFGSFFLALANLFYDIFCPPMIKRFTSINDLYQVMISIKKISLNVYPDDDFQGSFQHCTEGYETQRKLKPVARGLCSFFYLSAAVLFTIIFIHRSWVVLTSVFPSYILHQWLNICIYYMYLVFLP